MPQQPSTSPPPAMIVTVVPATPAPERGLGDVIYGSIAIVAVLVVLGLALGTVVGALRFGWFRTHRPEADHMPPVKPGRSPPTS